MPEYKLSTKFSNEFSLYSKQNVQDHLSRDFDTLSKVEPGGSAKSKFRSWAHSMQDLTGKFKKLKNESEENQKDDVKDSSILSERANFIKDYIIKTLLDPIDLKEKVNFDREISNSSSKEKWNQFGNGSQELSEYREILYKKAEEERKYINQNCKNVKDDNKKDPYDYDDENENEYRYSSANELVENINKKYGNHVDKKNSSLLNMGDYITENFIKGLADVCKNKKLDSEEKEDFSNEIDEFSDDDSLDLEDNFDDFEDIDEDAWENKKNNNKAKKIKKNRKVENKEKSEELKYPNLYNFLYLNGNNLINWTTKDEQLSDGSDKLKKIKKIGLEYLLDAAIADLRKYENEYTYKLQKQEKKGLLKRGWEEIKRPFSKMKQSIIGEKKNEDLVFDKVDEEEKRKKSDNDIDDDEYDNEYDDEYEDDEDKFSEKENEKSRDNLDLTQMEETAFLSTLISNAHKQLNGIEITNESEEEDKEDIEEEKSQNIIDIDDHDYDPYWYIEKLSNEKKIDESGKLKKYYENRAELLALYDSLSNMDLDKIINKKNNNDYNINYDKEMLKKEIEINNKLNSEKTKKSKLDEDLKTLGVNIKMSGIEKDKIAELRKQIVGKDKEYNKCNENIKKYEKDLDEINRNKAKIKDEYKKQNYASEFQNLSNHVHLILDKIYVVMKDPELEIRRKVDSAKKYTDAMKHDQTWSKDDTYEHIASEILSCNLDSYSTHYSDIISQIKENRIKTKFWDDDIDFEKISFNYSGKDNTINNPNSLEPNRGKDHIKLSDFDKIKDKFPKSVKDLKNDNMLNRLYHPYSELCNIILDNHLFKSSDLNNIIENENQYLDEYINEKKNFTSIEISTLKQLIDLNKNNKENKEKLENELKIKQSKYNSLSEGKYDKLSPSEYEEFSKMINNSNEILKRYVTSNFDIQISNLDKKNSDLDKISTEVESLLENLSKFQNFYDKNQKDDLEKIVNDYNYKKNEYNNEIKIISDRKNEMKKELEKEKIEYNKSISDSENNAKNNGGNYKLGIREWAINAISFKSLKSTTDLKTQIINKSREYDGKIIAKVNEYKKNIEESIKKLNNQKTDLSKLIQKYKKDFNNNVIKKLESSKKQDDEKIKKEKEDINRKIDEEFEKNREYMKRLNSGESIQKIWDDKNGKNKKNENDDSKKACEFLMRLVNSIRNQPEQSAE